jgi:hypothetical protein
LKEDLEALTRPRPGGSLAANASPELLGAATDSTVYSDHI